MLEFYILNRDVNRKKMYMMNIFDNCYVRENAIIERDKYLADRKNYSYVVNSNFTMLGYTAFKRQIECILKHEFWARCQYEFLASDLFARADDQPQKIDGWFQCESNIDAICNVIINSTEKE